MRICGVSLESTDAVVAIVECIPSHPVTPVPSETRRIALPDHKDPKCLKSFSSTIEALVRDFAIDCVAIRACTYSGKYQSGAPAMKMEGLLQVSDVNTILLSPQTIAARCNSDAFDVPKSLKKYQHDAYKAAYTHALQEMEQ